MIPRVNGGCGDKQSMVIVSSKISRMKQIRFIQLTYFPWNSNIGHTDSRNKWT